MWMVNQEVESCSRMKRESSPGRSSWLDTRLCIRRGSRPPARNSRIRSAPLSGIECYPLYGATLRYSNGRSFSGPYHFLAVIHSRLRNLLTAIFGINWAGRLVLPISLLELATTFDQHNECYRAQTLKVKSRMSRVSLRTPVELNTSSSEV